MGAVGEKALLKEQTSYNVLYTLMSETKGKLFTNTQKGEPAAA